MLSPSGTSILALCLDAAQLRKSQGQVSGITSWVCFRSSPNGNPETWRRIPETFKLKASRTFQSRDASAALPQNAKPRVDTRAVKKRRKCNLGNSGLRGSDLSDA